MRCGSCEARGPRRCSPVGGDLSVRAPDRPLGAVPRLRHLHRCRDGCWYVATQSTAGPSPATVRRIRPLSTGLGRRHSRFAEAIRPAGTVLWAGEGTRQGPSPSARWAVTGHASLSVSTTVARFPPGSEGPQQPALHPVRRPRHPVMALHCPGLRQRGQAGQRHDGFGVSPSGLVGNCS